MRREARHWGIKESTEFGGRKSEFEFQLFS
jgi:hypothetical protein